MRNALSLIDGAARDFDWTPANIPPDFLVERGSPDPLFADMAGKLGLADMSSDWDKVLAISKHLLAGTRELPGNPIQSDLGETYRAITQEGEGYCGDFTRVFMAFVITAGIPVRAWAFSFDGFGGHGHILPEIWNRQLGRWQLIDIYNNAYFRGADGVALSAAEVRQAIAEASKSIQRSRLFEGARHGFVIEEKFWDYYRRGLAEWYMVWGNNVFSYDKKMSRWPLGHWSRSLEQMGAIAIGVYPPLKLLTTDLNRRQADAMWRLRAHLFAAGSIAGLAMLLLIVCLARQALERCHRRNGYSA